MAYAILVITASIVLVICAEAYEDQYWRHGGTGKLYGCYESRNQIRLCYAEPTSYDFQGPRMTRVIWYRIFIDDAGNKRVQMHRGHEDLFISSYEEFVTIYYIWRESGE
jgi:hypothetical protein